MITAIVLIQAAGSVPELAERLLQIPEVAEAYSVAGEYDLVAILRVREYGQVADVVPGRIADLQGVGHTTTLMAFKCYSRHDLEELFSIGYEET